MVEEPITNDGQLVMYDGANRPNGARSTPRPQPQPLLPADLGGEDISDDKFDEKFKINLIDEPPPFIHNRASLSLLTPSLRALTQPPFPTTIFHHPATIERRRLGERRRRREKEEGYLRRRLYATTERKKTPLLPPRRSPSSLPSVAATTAAAACRRVVTGKVATVTASLPLV
ncbi:hypothetical protein PIB30_045697 [Stylosanthes scabra]|uniref:Uncharacterized protein n=1 Tax=Stylosanthes scabra TaxID=79078 RepID=A0ABU6TI71_9FABA|nr:hypothetical protein [Stylosanthes scabra]